MIQKRVAVIGGGPAGLTTAYQLAKNGIEVDLFEASNQVGGMSKSLNLWDQTVDIGPHRFFSSDRRVNEFWLEIAGDDYQMVNRLTRIYYNQKFFNYPLKPSNALKNLGFKEAFLCMLSFFHAQIFPPKNKDTFEAWVTHRFGKRLYKIFFKTYSEKLWGISCKDLDADFAAQRIKKLSLWGAVWNAFIQGKNNKHKTLVDQFAYPLKGTGMIYNRIKKRTEGMGGNIYLKTPVEKVLTENNEATGIMLKDGTIKKYDYIVSSMPLTLMVSRLINAPEKIINLSRKLNYRNTIIVYMKIKSEAVFPDNWLYIHTEGLNVGRITNFRNWAPSLYGDESYSILAMEYWCNDDDELWTKPDDELIKMASEELSKTNLVDQAKIKAGHVHHIHRCYPVYEAGYQEILNPIENHLKQIDKLYCVGRYGSFKYNNQDHSILMGLLAAENIIHDKTIHNLWEVNTDYDNYQENAIITKTGLQLST